MMKRAISLGALAAVAFGGAATAQVGHYGPSTYGTIGYSQMDHNNGNLGAITARYGNKVNRNLGFEGELSAGISNDNYNWAGRNGSVKLSYDVGAYVVGSLPVSPHFDLFGRMGLGYSKIANSIGGPNNSDTGTSFNWGAGANYYFDGQNGIRGDWTRREFTRSNSGSADVYSINYVRRF